MLFRESRAGWTPKNRQKKEEAGEKQRSRGHKNLAEERLPGERCEAVIFGIWKTRRDTREKGGGESQLKVRRKRRARDAMAMIMTDHLSQKNRLSSEMGGEACDVKEGNSVSNSGELTGSDRDVGKKIEKGVIP